MLIWVPAAAGSKPMLNKKQRGWIFVSVQFLLIALTIIISARDSQSIIVFENTGNIIGISIILSGFILMILVLLNFKQIMTPNPVPMHNYVLKTTGFYKYIRHPMYSAALFTLLGVVFYYQSLSGFVFWIIAVFFIIYKIRFEERNLTEKFPDYIKYSSRTKKLIPFVY
jgi:protein-S-isoprenylcysteine O-methyltransferase Ste14